MSHVKVTVTDIDRVALVSVSAPPVNTINGAVRAELGNAVARLSERRDLAAVVLMCEGSTFFSGADIGEFAGPPREGEYRELFRRIEQLRVPVIAAMHGTVMGGGLEIALACHYRIAARETRCGLPEITLGIIPGAGGTQRLPRLIGVDQTLELILGARPVDAGIARQMGFIDDIVSGDLKEGALAYARALLDANAGPRRTCDFAVDPATATEEVLARRTQQAAKQYPNRQAPFTAIDAVGASSRLLFPDGLAYETRLVNEAKATLESRALVHVFFAERATRRIPDLPPETAARPVASAAVIGAGTMGRGIAVCFANAGIPVTLLDTGEEPVARALEAIGSIYDSMVSRGRISANEKAARLQRIRGTADFADLHAADLVIEAVYESMDLKKDVFARLDAVAKPGAILATNTSTLDIEEIGRAVHRPQDVIGLHFFSPADVMPLLEVVRTAQTAPEVIRTSMDLARTLRKTPVLARVCYGFIGNRMMEGYAREAERMVLEGATPRQVDSALEDWGMAMGILAVFDMAGIDVGINVHRAHADRYPPDPTYYQADFALHAAGRLGQKTGRGYYRYEPGDRRRHDDPQALAILRERARELGVTQREHTADEIIERCTYALMNEGFRILEEGVALRASDIDVVWTSGYGFPRYRGGPMFHAEALGLPVLYEGILKFRETFGPMHWQPAALLERLVREGRTLADWEGSRA